jgi:hydrogenase expression/formation protein HypE
MTMRRIGLIDGAGGMESRDLIREVFLDRLPAQRGPAEDAARFCDDRMAISIDGFVVDPAEFPGGDIGKLAVCGTVNDLAVRGAVPRWLAVSWIVPEGLSIDQLNRYATSLARTANEAGIAVVAGDTKVVPAEDLRGPAVTTCGVGEVYAASSIASVRADDVLLISGRVAEHTTALLAAREGLIVDDLPPSDCAVLHGLTSAAFAAGAVFARDVTRGGLAAVLWEIADATGVGVRVEREQVPVHPAVADLCSLIGLDPLYLANEGCVLFAVRPHHADAVLAAVRTHPLGRAAALVGRIVESGPVEITADGRRMPLPGNAVPLPRLC